MKSYKNIINKYQRLKKMSVDWQEELLKDEYIELNMAQETDNISCDLSLLKARDNRIGEIKDSIDGEILEIWDNELKELLEEYSRAEDLILEEGLERLREQREKL